MLQINRRAVRQSGFTIIELMIVLAIAGVLLVVAAPSFNETIKNNRRDSLMRGFVTALMTARSEAVKAGKSTVMCISADGTSCAGSTGTWESGWLIYRDDNANQALDGGEPVLLSSDAFPLGYTLRSAGGAFTSWISFRPTGDITGNVSTNDIFRLCAPDRDSAKADYLQFSRFGQPMFVTSPQSNCP